jgi:general L-amino acid transport system substrate-binding protein
LISFGTEANSYRQREMRREALYGCLAKPIYRGANDGAIDGMTLAQRGALSLATLIGLLVLLPALRCGAAAGVLEKVRAREKLVCGVSERAKEHSAGGGDPAWSGIGADFCRAVAAAVLGNKDAVSFRALQRGEASALLQSGAVDVTSGNIPVTLSHEASHGMRFPAVLVFGGQGFMVRKAQGVASALELSGARICVTAGTADADGIADYFGALRMPFELSKFEKWSDAVMAYSAKSCQVLSADIFTLALARQQLGDAGDQIILPELAARNPLGPAILQGDDTWFGIVRWTTYALIAAEELGITSANIDAMKASPSATVRRLLGLDGDIGARVGLSPDWAQRAIRQIGNYGELFERHLGPKSPLKLDRRLNNLAANGGLHYAPSFR